MRTKKRRRNESAIRALTGLVLLFLSVSAILCGCAGKYSAEEIAAAARPLIEASAELNEIYFGAGLPAETSPARLDRFFSATGISREKAAYLPVASDCRYQTREELARATRAVYGMSYSTYLLDLGFKGVSDGSDDEVELGVASVIYARFRTLSDVFGKGDTVLCVRADLDRESIPLADCIFLYDELKILRTGSASGNEWVRFSVPAKVLDEEGTERTVIDVTLRLIRENGVWRLDSPTYVSRLVYEDETSS